MVTILVSLVSLVVVVGVLVAVWQTGHIRRYIDTDIKLMDTVLTEVDDDEPRPGRPSTLATVTHISRRLRPSRRSAVAAAGMFGVLMTCTCFVLFSKTGGPTATPPGPAVQTVMATVATTVTNERPGANITRTPDGGITVVVRTPAPVPPASSATRPATNAAAQQAPPAAASAPRTPDPRSQPTSATPTPAAAGPSAEVAPSNAPSASAPVPPPSLPAALNH